MARRPRQQRIEAYGQFRPTGVDDSAARRMQALAGLGATVAGVAEQFGRAKAEELAPLKTKEAIDEATSVDPETGEVTLQKVEMKTGLGWGKDAYNAEITVHNKAVSDAYLSNIDRDNIAKITELRDNNLNDSLAFETKANAYAKGVIETVSPEYQGIVSNSLLQTIFNVTEKLKSTERKNDIASSINTQLENLTLKANNLTIQSFNGEDVSSQVIELEEGIKAVSALSPEQKKQQSKRLLDLKKSIYESKISGELNRIAEGQSSEDAYAKLTELKKEIHANYNSDEWSSFINRQQEKLRKTSSLIKSANAVATDEAINFINGVTKQVSLGINVSDEDFIKAKSLAVTKEQKNKLANAEQVAIYTVSTAQERQQLLTTASEFPETAELAGQMISAEKQLQTQLTKDAFGFSVQQGIAKNTFIDVLNPTKEQVLQRRQQAEIATQHQGMLVPTLSNQEINLLLSEWPKMTPKDQSKLADIYGPESFIWGKFSDKNQGVYAQGAAHPNPDVRQQIFDGKSALNEKATKFSDTANSQFERIFNNEVGSDTIPDQDYRDMLDASIAVYASITGQGTYSQTNGFKKAIKSVIGDVPKIRNYKTILPYNVTSDELENYFDNMDAETLQKLSTQEKTTEQLNQDLMLINQVSKIKAISNDRYLIQPNGGIGIFDGLKPLEFTVNRSIIDSMVDPQETEKQKDKLSKEYAESFATGAPSMARTPRDIPLFPGSSIRKN